MGEEGPGGARSSLWRGEGTLNSLCEALCIVQVPQPPRVPPARHLPLLHRQAGPQRAPQTVKKLPACCRRNVGKPVSSGNARSRSVGSRRSGSGESWWEWGGSVHLVSRCPQHTRPPTQLARNMLGLAAPGPASLAQLWNQTQDPALG